LKSELKPSPSQPSADSKSARPQSGGDVRRVALLGAGYIADWHALALHSVPGVELAAVCDRLVAKADALARKFGVAHVYESLDEMLAAEKATPGGLDAVHILTPPDRHFDAARAVLEAGVHVFLEKPMCAAADDCDALVQLADRRGLRLGVGHNFLFAENYERLRQDVKSGVLGLVDDVTITWHRPMPQAIHGPFDAWMLRDPRNILIEVGSHSAAHMLDLIGEPEAFEVRPSNAAELPTGIKFYRRWEVNALRGRTAVELRFSFVPGFSEYTIHVRGSLASATVDFERNTYTLDEHRPSSPDFDNYGIVLGRAKSLKRQGRRTLAGYIKAKLKLGRRGNPYGASIARAMDAFYGPLPMDARVDGRMGARVVRLCEKMGALADFSAPTHDFAVLKRQEISRAEKRQITRAAVAAEGMQDAGLPLPQGLKPGTSLVEAGGTTERVAEEGQKQGEFPEKHASGAKAPVDSADLMPGMNPWPTAPASFSAACKVALFQDSDFARQRQLPDPFETASILVLGGTGFIGKELVRQLIHAGCTVRVFARSTSALPRDLRESGKLACVAGDIANKADLLRAMVGIEVVFHLARANVKSWAEYQELEIEATRRVGECALASGVKRLVYTGTIDSYYCGAGAGTITEETPLDPRIERRNLYARAKAASEAILMRMHRDQGLPVVIVRPGIVIGRGGSPFHWGVGMWWNDAVCQTWGDGRNKLALVLVEDVAAGLIGAMETPAIEGRAFNLVGDPMLTAQEYLDALDKEGGIRIQRHTAPIARFYLLDMMKWLVKVAVRHPERRMPSYLDWESRTGRAVFDCSAAKSALGWKPVSERDELVRRGIKEPLDEFFG
jgi:predicted dehydrogenase/nucleoside-diphosphate-sugar epimerase